MATFNSVNFNNLNRMPTVKSEDKLIIEDENGAHLIDINFFNLQKENTSFYTVIETVSSNLTPISAEVIALKSKLSASSVLYTDTVFNFLSSTINAEYTKIYHRTGTLTIRAGSNISTNIVIPVSAGVTLSAYDVNLEFGSTTFAAISGGVVNLFTSLTGNPVTGYVLRANLSNISTFDTVVYWNIFKPY